jgi:chromatin remodeling complex protein RSC6
LAAKKRRKTKAKSRRKTKAKSRRKTKAKKRSKSKSKSKAKRKPFGGYAISFAGRTETVEQIFGKKPVTPSEMTKKIWVFIKSRRLATK